MAFLLFQVITEKFVSSLPLGYILRSIALQSFFLICAMLYLHVVLLRKHRLITPHTGHPVVAEIPQYFASGAERPGKKRKDAYRRIQKQLEMFPAELR